MEPKLSLGLSAMEDVNGGTSVHLRLYVTNPDGTRCYSLKRVSIPAAPNLEDAYGWAQDVLCAMADGLDCLCDVQMTHDAKCEEREDGHA